MPEYTPKIFTAPTVHDYPQAPERDGTVFDFSDAGLRDYATRAAFTGAVYSGTSDFLYYVAAISASSILVQFNRTLGGASVVPADYVITGPTVLTVNTVSVGSSSVTLGVSGAWAGGTYTLTIGTRKCYDIAMNYNTGTATFVQPVAAGTGGANFNTGFN